MYSIIISVITGSCFGTALWYFNASSWPWATAFGFLLVIVGAVVSVLIVQKLVVRRMAEMQTFMAEGQKKIQMRAEASQKRPTGDLKKMMAEFDKMQKSILTEALEHTKRLEPYKKWVPLFAKQITTMRMQLYYQMQNFKKVDELMPKTIMLDQMTASMRISRMYTHNADVAEMAKVFEKAMTRLKYNQSVLLHALMAWIYVQKNMFVEAHAILVKACARNENQVLKKNLDLLANKQTGKFSNSGLGDEWFSLFLEQPKMYIRRQPTRMDGRPF